MLGFTPRLSSGHQIFGPQRSPCRRLSCRHSTTPKHNSVKHFHRMPPTLSFAMSGFMTIANVLLCTSIQVAEDDGRSANKRQTARFKPRPSSGFVNYIRWISRAPSSAYSFACKRALNVMKKTSSKQCIIFICKSWALGLES